MSPELPDTWRSRVSGSADRRGIPLATIVVAVAVTIGLVDLNVALVVVLWVLRKIVLYTVVAFFFALLLTPATRFLGRHGLSHGGATALVFLAGALVLGGLVYLFVSPLVTAAEHFGRELPSLVRDARKGRGPIGHLVYRLHLQKYLAKGSTQLTDQLTKVLKPATAFSVGAAALSSLITIGTIAVLTYFAMLEAPRLWRGFLGLFSPPTALRLNRVIDETVRAVTGYVLGDAMTSVIAGVLMFIILTVFGVPFAILLGVFVALVDLLPLVGGLIAGVPVVIIASIHSVPAGIITLVVFLIYQQIENHFLNPVIMSRTVRLNPLWVLLAVLIGAALGGRIGGGLGSFIGALIGIPLGGALQVVMREIRRGPEGLEDGPTGGGTGMESVIVD